MGKADPDTPPPALPAPRFGWAEVRTGRCISASWGRLLRSGQHIDPYLVWADASGFASFGGLPSNEQVDGGKLAVLVELKVKAAGYVLPDPTACDGAPRDVDPVFCLVDTPGAYKTEDSELDGRRFTARVLPANVCHLLDCESVERVQLGVPRIPSTAVDAPRGAITTGGDNDKPRTVIGIIDDGCAFAHPAFCAADGSPRVHFLWDQNPRDGAAAKAVGWDVEPQLFGYGAELTHAVLRKVSMEAVSRGSDLYAYKQLDYAPVTLDLQMRSSGFKQQDGEVLPGELMRTASHGTSVMYLAAGVLPQAGNGAIHPVDAQRALHWQSAAAARDDHAAEWPIIFVQLPTRTTLDTSGGSLGVHVLDGVRYILERAQRLESDDATAATPRDAAVPDKDDKAVVLANRVVINISYGAVAGCHDGTSILELALAHLVADRSSNSQRSCWITIAAGNAHQSGTHARLTLAEGGSSGSLQWTVAPDNPLESYLEIWLPDVDVRGDDLPAQVAPNVRVTLMPPGCDALQQLQCGRAQVLYDAAATQRSGKAGEALPVAGAVFSKAVAQGLRGTMVLLAVARTRAPLTGNDDSWPVAPHGIWRIDVSWLGQGADPGPTHARMIDVHAWAERNDLVWGNLRAQQSTVVAEVPPSEPTEFTAEARALIERPRLGRIPGVSDPMQPRYSLGTLAGLAMDDASKHGHGRLWVAAGHRLADGEVATYSSGGPYRQHNPVFAADGELQNAARASAYAEWDSRPRFGPDVSAPSDVGVALRGLRVAGTRAAGVARLSGTSAAAPLAARFIANRETAAIWKVGKPEASPNAAVQAEPAATPAASRPTTSPAADDRYRASPMPIN